MSRGSTGISGTGCLDKLPELSLRAVDPFLSLSLSPPFFDKLVRLPRSMLLPESVPAAREAGLSAGLDRFDLVLLKGFHLFDIDLDMPLGLGLDSDASPPEVTVVRT